MASPSPISTFEGGYERSQESNRKKRRKIIGDSRLEDVQTNRLQWKTTAEQQIYSVNLVEALRRSPSSPATVTSGGIRSSIRETADRVLAVSARGRTRWSRAILSCRLRSRLVNKRHKKVKLTNKIQPKRKPARTNAPPLQRKVQILGRLVPGCRKLPFHNLLEETTDYIAALEMQVKAMSALAVLLNGAGAATATADSDHNSSSSSSS